MPISNHGPFSIYGNNGEYRMFVCDDGIVIVRPSILRHLPGALTSQFLGGAVGGGIGGGVDAVMGHNEYRRSDQKAERGGFVSSENLKTTLPRSWRYPVDDVAAVTLKKNKVAFMMRTRHLRSLGSRKVQWYIGRDDTPAQTALKELFGDRFQILE